jgi:hypothetical protein
VFAPLLFARREWESKEASGEDGIWQSLYSNVKKYALSMNYTHILLNTKPTQFPAMWNFLQENKAEVYKREMTEDGEKYFLKIPIF